MAKYTTLNEGSNERKLRSSFEINEMLSRFTGRLRRGLGRFYLEDSGAVARPRTATIVHFALTPELSNIPQRPFCLRMVVISRPQNLES
jgi:hypothetical protein